MHRIIPTLFIGAVLSLSAALPAYGKTIKVGAYNFSPLCEIQVIEPDDPVVDDGFYVALLRAIAAREKWDLMFIPGSLSECLQRLGDGEIDLLPAVAYSKELANVYDFTHESVISTWGQVYARDKTKIQSWFDLTSKSIGVVRDDPYSNEARAILKRFDISCRFIEFRDYLDVFKALENKWIDAGIVDRLYGASHEKKFPIEKTSILFSPVELRFAVPKDMNGELIAALDYELSLLKKDPSSIYYQLLDKLAGADENIRIRKIMGWSLFGTFAAAGLLGGMSFVLRRQVRKKTAELSRNYEELKKEILMRQTAESAFLEIHERFRALFEFAPEAIFLVTPEGDITDCNETAEEITGYPKRELLQMSVSELMMLPAPGAEGVARITLRNDCEGIQCKRANGETFPTQISTRSLELGDEKGLLMIVRDLTVQKRMEEEMMRAQKLESIGVLAGGIAHDFNNLLGAILGNISLAKICMQSEEKCRQKLATAEQACMRAKDLVHQLLTFSRGGAPVKEAASVSTVIEESCQFSLRGSNVKCEIDISDNLWIAEIDVGQISQVINNIIINAKQAMVDGGSIHLGVENKIVEKDSDTPLPPGRYVRISIKDNGPGIPREHLSKVFDPYFTTKTTGNGLGLATSYSIVKRHGGHISVQSDAGVGTTFHIHLPASERKVPKLRDATRQLNVGRGAILIMDDEDIIREALEEMLSVLNYEVKSARDGSEAVKIYKEKMESGEKFDAVVMDLTIPGGIGGKEAMGMLLEIDPSVKTIVSSGYSNDPVMAEYRKYGFAGVIVKPYTLQELADVIHRIISENDVNKEESYDLCLDRAI
jgi:PAS domain S-box-containing protein